MEVLIEARPLGYEGVCHECGSILRLTEQEYRQLTYIPNDCSPLERHTCPVCRKALYLDNVSRCFSSRYVAEQMIRTNSKPKDQADPLTKEEANYLINLLYTQSWTEQQICDSIVKKLNLAEVATNDI